MKTLSWTPQSVPRNDLTARLEPVQPALLFEFMTRVGATIFLDVGANVGYYSILMSHLPQIAQIVAFEGSATTWTHLRDNVAMNNLASLISCEHCAVSDKLGTVQFQIEGDLSGVNSVAGANMHNSARFKSMETVQARTLDSMINVRGQRLGIKVDVEGHEEAVLRGAKTLLSGNTCVVQMEAFGDSIASLETAMSQIGYTRIFRASHDLYFTNEPTLRSTTAILAAVEEAMNRTVQMTLGIWPKADANSVLNASARREGLTIVADCAAGTLPLEGSAEFAYYVLVDGKRLHFRKYESESRLIFTLPQELLTVDSKVVVRAFVRDRNYPNRIWNRIINI